MYTNLRFCCSAHWSVCWSTLSFGSLNTGDKIACSCPFPIVINLWDTKCIRRYCIHWEISLIFCQAVIRVVGKWSYQTTLKLLSGRKKIPVGDFTFQNSEYSGDQWSLSVLETFKKSIVGIILSSRATLSECLPISQICDRCALWKQQKMPARHRPYLSLGRLSF